MSGGPHRRPRCDAASISLSPRQALALAVIVLDWRAPARAIGLAMEGTRQPWEAASKRLHDLARRGLVECIVDDLGPRWSLTARGWTLTQKLQSAAARR